MHYSVHFRKYTLTCLKYHIACNTVTHIVFSILHYSAYFWKYGFNAWYTTLTVTYTILQKSSRNTVFLFLEAIRSLENLISQDNSPRHKPGFIYEDLISQDNSPEIPEILFSSSWRQSEVWKIWFLKIILHATNRALNMKIWFLKIILRATIRALYMKIWFLKIILHATIRAFSPGLMVVDRNFAVGFFKKLFFLNCTAINKSLFAASPTVSLALLITISFNRIKFPPSHPHLR